MTEAGFCLWFSGPRPADDRFLLVFGKTPPADMSPESDPFVGGPEISGSPKDWLKQNLWRLRGMKTAGGKIVLFGDGNREAVVEAIPAATPGKEAWRLPKSKLVLSFEKQGERYVLSDSWSTDQQQ